MESQSPKYRRKKPTEEAVEQPRAPMAMPLLDRVLPNSLEGERCVLGAMMIDPAGAGSVIRTKLTAEDFYYASNQVIYTHLCEMQDAMLVVDNVTLVERLRDKGVLEEVGGGSYIASLLMDCPTSAHAEHYADMVKKKAVARRVIGLCHDAIGRGFDNPEIEAWLPLVQQELLDVSIASVDEVKPFSEHVVDSVGRFEQWHEHRGQVLGLATGFRDLDHLTGGLNPGNYFVIAARPSMGKSALAMNIAENVSCAGKAVGVFSLEMSIREMTDRMVASRARVNLRQWQNGFGKSSDIADIATAASELRTAPIFIDDTGALPVAQLRARARRMKLRHDIQLLVVDYLQLVRAPSRRSESSRQVEVSDVSAGMKALAKELKIPVIVLCQLNREPEQRDGGMPKLSDLRESGSIEQDADIVGLLVRPIMYADDDEERNALHGKATLRISKQRNGPTGDVELLFQEEFVRFVDKSRLDEVGD